MEMALVENDANHPLKFTIFDISETIENAKKVRCSSTCVDGFRNDWILRSGSRGPFRNRLVYRSSPEIFWLLPLKKLVFLRANQRTGFATSCTIGRTIRSQVYCGMSVKRCLPTSTQGYDLDSFFARCSSVHQAPVSCARRAYNYSR